jgi:vacuolar protein sorting-associated protein 13A/C
MNIEDIGTVYLRLGNTGDSKPPRLVCADVKISGSTIFVSFSPADEMWPFTFENKSDHKVTVYQTVSRALEHLNRV